MPLTSQVSDKKCAYNIMEDPCCVLICSETLSVFSFCQLDHSVCLSFSSLSLLCFWILVFMFFIKLNKVFLELLSWYCANSIHLILF